MRHVFIAFVLLGICGSLPVYSQMSLVQCTPAVGAEGVPLADTLSWIFDQPLDTLARWNNPGSCLAVLFFDPFTDFEVTGHAFSHDLRVTAIMVTLQPNTDYVWVFTNARGTSGDSLGVPIVGAFTTAASHGPHTVSGSINYSGSVTGVVAALFDRNPALGQGFPVLKAATVITPGHSDYTIPYVRDGVYWPVALRDNNHDGVIDQYVDEAGGYDPDDDGMPDSLVVSGDSPTGIILNLHVSAAAQPRTAVLPQSIVLTQNYPNPFNPSTEIQFSLSRAQTVTLSVYDMLGQEVATLASGEMAAGVHTVQFDGRNLPTGIYFYRLKAGDFVSTRKMMLLK